MFLRTFVSLLVLQLSLLAGFCHAQPVTVFAAASMKDALDDIAQQFTQHTGTQLKPVMGATSALARQISFGAPADVFIAANEQWMDYLADAGLIQAASRFNLAYNQLILIGYGPQPAIADMAQFKLAPDTRMAVALVDAVPAGIYAKQALQHFALWEQLRQQIVQTDNVRAAYHLVALGEADFGVVYQTDLRPVDVQVNQAGRFPPESHQPIAYPAAAIKASSHPAVPTLLEFLQGPTTQAILHKHRFSQAPEPAMERP